MRSLSAYIIQGRMQAVVVASVFAMLSFLLAPLSIISAAAIALVTLRKGQLEGAIVILGAVVAVGALGALLSNHVILAVGYALGFWLPVWLVSILLRESGQLGFALEITVMLGFLGVAAVYLLSADPAAMWQEQLNLMLQPLLDNPPPGFEIHKVQQGLAVASHYMTGILVTGMLSTLLLALLLGRWWQAILFNPGGFRKEFLSIEIHTAVAYLCLLIFMTAGITGGVIGEFLQNISLPAFFLFLVVGVSVFHVFLSATRARRIFLPVVYIAMILIPYVMLPVAVVGFGETWLNMRQKMAVDGMV